MRTDPVDTSHDLQTASAKLPGLDTLDYFGQFCEPAAWLPGGWQSSLAHTNGIPFEAP